jgi:hypothetical protein
MRTHLTILLTLLTISTWACDCKIKSLKENQDLSYNYAQLIFIGDVVEIDTTTGNYKIEIVEILKGKSKAKIVKGTAMTSCSGFPGLGRWIIYAESFDGDTIEFSSCGMSRSFSDPQYVMISDYTYPLPPKDLSEMKSTDIHLDLLTKILTIKEKALSDLKTEIIDLRKRK